ncbi:helix-turn-helix domain-containing protein [Dactylosporangium cerinum]
MDAVSTTGCVSTHGAPSTTTPEPRAATFAAALRTWRLTRGLSQAALAKQIMYSRSLVNLVENGYRRATEAFARAADTALGAGGQLHAVRNMAASTVLTAPTKRHGGLGGIVAGTCAGRISSWSLTNRLDRTADRRDARGLVCRPPTSRTAMTPTLQPPSRRSACGTHPWYKRAPLLVPR